jgi:hypothetical protein
MPRALKTYVTNLGFFELAVAAPSMKAALEAWGMSHNAFQHGFAKHTVAPDIIAATSALPGVVLKRPVGSTGPFKENAELPRTLPQLKPPKVERRPPSVPPLRKPARAKAEKTTQADIISFERARAQREKEREKERAKEEAREGREREKRRSAIQKAEAALEEASLAHEEVMQAIARDRDKLDRREEQEQGRWKALQTRLEQAVSKARR